MKALILEGDKALGSYLQKEFAAEGYRVQVTDSGEAVLLEVQTQDHSLVLLDMAAARVDGIEMVRKMRAVRHDLPIVVLCSTADLNRKLECFDAGADDILAKPFSFSELAARCRALQRRYGSTRGAVLTQQELLLNRITRRVTWHDTALELTAKEFQLLEYLLLHKDRCVGRVELLREVWTMHPDSGTNVVDVYINYLRRKFAAVGIGGYGPIRTVRGEGYTLGVAESVAAAVPVSLLQRAAGLRMAHA